MHTIVHPLELKIFNIRGHLLPFFYINKMTKIAITKKELQLIIEAVDAKKAFLLKTDNRLSEYNSLSNKLDELSPYYEYVFDPVQYDEF
jgi:hypothetical protein